MDAQFGLAVADVQLLQSWHLLRKIMDKHPDSAAIAEAVASIRGAREIIAILRHP